VPHLELNLSPTAEDMPDMALALIRAIIAAADKDQDEMTVLLIHGEPAAVIAPYGHERPGRRPLRRLRPDPGLQRLHRVRHRRQALRERPLRTVFAAPPGPRAAVSRHGIIAAQLSGVFDAVTAARQPRSALNWLRKGAGAGLLADVAAGRLAISHEALDDCPHRRAADYLRHMLTAAGPLPARDEVARAGQWVTTILEAIEPAADRRLVRAYATWQVMRGLRASAAAATRPRTPTAHARNHIRAAPSLLAWIRSGGTELAACRQPDIDQWLRTGPSACLAFPGLGRVPRPLPEAEHPGTAAAAARCQFPLSRPSCGGSRG
jgi:hypothetical protein